MSRVISYEEIIAFHPGYYVKEMIEDLAMTQDELAKRLDTSAKTVSELVNGKINLSYELANKLSIVFGTSRDMWLNLNKTYLQKKLEIENRKRQDEECALVKQLDYKFWVDLGVVKPVKKSLDKVEELKKYFQISSLLTLNRRDFLVQYRTTVSEVKDTNVINANAWVQTALNLGNSIEVEKFDTKKLISKLSEIRQMTLQSPTVFFPRLREIFASCGVAFVILPTLKNSGINGAVKWFDEKVILAINDRRKSADIFWFSLFHEIGHLLQKRTKKLIVSNKDNKWIKTDSAVDILEEEADSFARNMLIPEERYIDFIKKSMFNELGIKKFATEIQIHPSIVLGRLQSDGYVGYNTTLNSLKIQYHVIINKE